MLESYPSLVSSREAGAIFRVRIWVVVFILKVGYMLMLMLQSKLGDDSAERKKSLCDPVGVGKLLMWKALPGYSP